MLRKSHDLPYETGPCQKTGLPSNGKVSPATLTLAALCSAVLGGAPATRTTTLSARCQKTDHIGADFQFQHSASGENGRGMGVF